MNSGLRVDRVAVRRILAGLIMTCLLAGCAAVRPRAEQPVTVPNPMVISAPSYEAAWERAIDVLHAYHFQIERENRQARTIETEYRVGSGIFEPWHKDSVNWSNRLESTLQSIRRKVVITVTPAGRQNNSQRFSLQVVALKEQEDLDAIAANSPGGATFQEHDPLDRDLTPVLGQSRPSGWIPRGRDLDLERAILLNLQNE